MSADKKASELSAFLDALRTQHHLGHDHFSGNTVEGLRERKKRMTRQLISDTATAMFLKDGFDAVRVIEVAAACGVSEKTVYNYFPTKESLILDREESMSEGIRRTLGPESAHTSPIDAVVELIADDVRQTFLSLDHGGHEVNVTVIRRFGDLFDQTPSLRAAQQEMMERMVMVAANAMADRAGVDPQDPEPQIAAHALLGLWRIVFVSMRKFSDGSKSAAEVSELVLNDLHRAARLIDTGLWSFGIVVQGNDGRTQIKAAAESANEARKQVVTAIRQARSAWKQIVIDAHTAKSEAVIGKNKPTRGAAPRRGPGAHHRSR